MRRRLLAAATLLASACGMAANGPALAAQEGPVPVPALTDAHTNTLAASDQGPGSCCVLNEGTSVEIEVASTLNSATLTRGERFQIRLVEPLVVDGLVVVPTGTTGEGEVIHAERSRGGGKPGELLLAARHLDINGTRLPLRGMKLGASGQDRTGVALATAFAAGPFAHFIRGREIEIPSGTRAHARLSVTARITPMPAALGDTSPPAIATPDPEAHRAPDDSPADTPSTKEP